MAVIGADISGHSCPMNILEQLLGSKTRVRMLRLFFRNPETFFTLREICQRAKLNQTLAAKELTALKKMGFVTIKVVTMGKTRRRKLWGANRGFSLWRELETLVLKSSKDSFSILAQEVKKLGGVKLAVAGGMFINQDNARADILIVAKPISKRKLANFIENLEADSGREINCIAVTPIEFKYRYDLYDRVVRNMLSQQNVRLINKLGY